MITIFFHEIKPLILSKLKYSILIHKLCITSSIFIGNSLFLYLSRKSLIINFLLQLK